MDDGGPTASYVVFFVLLLIDMLFYGFGAAIKALNSKEISEAADNPDNKRAKRLQAIIAKPEQYINTVQMAVTIINLVMGGFFLSMWKTRFQMLIDREIIQRIGSFVLSEVLLSVIAVMIAGALLLYILLTFGVLVPKYLGAKYAKQWAYTCINSIYYITKIFFPVTGLVSVTAKGILRMFGIYTDDNSEDVTEAGIISMVNEGHEQGVLLATEAEMITKIFEFGDKEAEDIMIHRKNILAIDMTFPLSKTLDYMLEEGKSRFPVYDGTIDNILGILHLRDTMRAHMDEANRTKNICEIEGIIRETMFIPETKNIDDLFKTMQQTKTQMVIVVDEYGQTSGLIAMEDILEEIVGNIMDEYDEDEEHIEETDNADEYIIEGMTPLDELEDKFDISFCEEEFETLNGFLISKMDKIPEENEKFVIEVDGYEFKILSVENRMIKSILVTRLPDKEMSEVAEEEAPEESAEREKGE